MKEADPHGNFARELSILRAAARHEEPLPPGLITRLEAGTRRAQRHERLSWEQQTVVGCVAFSAVLTLVPGTAVPAALLGLAVACGAYAAVAERVTAA
jgi:hypothetical protein